MKTALVTIGILLVLGVTYVAWVIFQATRTSGVGPLGRAEVGPEIVRVNVTLAGADTEYQITEIVFPRTWGEALSISAPDGFSATPYTLDDTGNPADPDSAAWVRETNEKDVRWVGSANLKAGATLVLEFPIRNSVPGEGSFRFQCERKIGISGQISFFSVAVAIGAHAIASDPD